MTQANKREEILESLRKTHDQAPWEWLAPHLTRDAVILVDPELDLLEVAYRVAVDDKQAIQTWLQQRKLRKPTSGQIQHWNCTPEKVFSVVVVQPYVLAMEL